MGVKKMLEARSSKGEEKKAKRLKERVPRANLGNNSSCSHQLDWKTSLITWHRVEYSECYCLSSGAKLELD